MMKIGKLYKLSQGILAKKEKSLKRRGNIYVPDGELLLVEIGPYRWFKFLRCSDAKTVFYWLSPYDTAIEFFQEHNEIPRSNYIKNVIDFLYKINPKLRE